MVEADFTLDKSPVGNPGLGLEELLESEGGLPVGGHGGRHL
jgi:hypothetical protein